MEENDVTSRHVYEPIITTIYGKNWIKIPKIAAVFPSLLSPSAHCDR